MFIDKSLKISLLLFGREVSMSELAKQLLVSSSLCSNSRVFYSRKDGSFSLFADPNSN